MDRLFAYSAEILSFARPSQDRTQPPDSATLERMLQRSLRLVQAAQKPHVILLGLGSGALAAALARDLPPEVRLLACTLQPGTAHTLRQAGDLAWWTPASRHGLLADTSPWALLTLLDMAGATARTACLLLNPESAEPGRSRLTALQRTLAAAILNPDEPDLEQFFAQFPAWLKELSVVWDAEQVPERTWACAAPLRQAARPLGNDFSAQRNAMLTLCQGDWVLYLDADETLLPDDWARIPGLCGQQEAAGWHFPRLTFYPDQDRCRMGLALRHHTHLRKRPEAIRAKLAVFDQAGGPRHTLSADYPHLPCGLLEPAPRGLSVRGLLLPSS